MDCHTLWQMPHPTLLAIHMAMVKLEIVHCTVFHSSAVDNSSRQVCSLFLQFFLYDKLAYKEGARIIPVGFFIAIILGNSKRSHDVTLFW